MALQKSATDDAVNYLGVTDAMDVLVAETHDAIARVEEVPKAAVILTPGGLATLVDTPYLFERRHVICLQGDFAGYRRAAARNAYGADHLPLTTIQLPPESRRTDLTCIAQAAAADPDSRIAMMTYPVTNPGGVEIEAHDIVNLAKVQPDLVIMVSAAYAFDGPGTRHLLQMAVLLPNLVVLRPSSKLLHLPGARLAWIVAAPVVIRRLSDRLRPYDVSRIGARLVVEMLNNVDQAKKVSAVQLEARDFLVERLARAGLTTRIAGLAPWVLVRIGANAVNFAKQIERQFCIRVQCYGEPHFGWLREWIRVSATAPIEMARAADAILTLTLHA